jgi:hypothetical protein
MTLKVDGTNGVLQAYDYQVLTTGFTYTFAAGTTTLVINPAGTLATGTITMPAAPVDGMVITITSTQQITALTLNGNTGQTVNNTTTFIAAASATAYVYRASSTTWFPFDSIPQLQNVPIGVGQTWQAVTGSRALLTNYTNSTGKPIQVYIVCSAGSSNGATLSIAGNTPAQVYTNVAGGRVALFCIVPNSTVYQLGDSGATIQSWWELR